MFDGLAKTFSDEMLSLSNGQLQCLPYSHALLDFFEARGTRANALVVRAVVFGRQDAVSYEDLLRAPSIPNLFRAAEESTDANGLLEFQFTPQASDTAETVKLPYRTLGFTHGTAALGSYHADGTWNVSVRSRDVLPSLDTSGRHLSNQGTEASGPDAHPKRARPQRRALCEADGRLVAGREKEPGAAIMRPAPTIPRRTRADLIISSAPDKPQRQRCPRWPRY
jgi:hypothetical protein